MALGTRILGATNESLITSGVGFGNYQYAIQISAALIASNSFTVKVNSTTSTAVVYATSNEATLRAIRAQLLSQFSGYIKDVLIPQSPDGYGTYTLKVICKPLGNFIVPIDTGVVTGGTTQPLVTIIGLGGLTELMLIPSTPLDVLLATRSHVDSSSSTIVYYGYALPGTTNAQSAWAVKRVTTANSTNVVTEWAGGIVSNEFVWDDGSGTNYEDLSYS